LQELGDVVVAQVVAEGGHAGAADGGAPVLDDVEQVPVGLGGHAGAGEVAGAQQEQGRPPGAAAVTAVAGDAVGVVEALAPSGPGRGLGVGQQPGQAPGEYPEPGVGGGEHDE